MKEQCILNIEKIERKINELILTKKNAAKYIFNDSYLDFCEEIDEKILKLRKKLIKEIFKNPTKLMNLFRVTCFKKLDGYLIEDFIRESNHTTEEFNKVLSEIEDHFIDNYITLWYSIKPITLNDWVNNFKELTKNKRYKWEPNFKRSRIGNKTILIKINLNSILYYWYIDKEYNFSHLFIVDNKKVKVLTKEEYLKLDIFNEILIKIFHKDTEFIGIEG